MNFLYEKKNLFNTIFFKHLETMVILYKSVCKKIVDKFAVD